MLVIESKRPEESASGGERRAMKLGKTIDTKRRGVMTKALLLTLAMAATGAQALTIKMTDASPTYGPVKKDPCPRGDAKDVCSITGYIKTGDGAVRSNTADIFSKGFKAWNDAQPGDKKWTLADGGDLEGDIEVNLFRTYNDCPGFAGVEVRALFKPKTPGNVWWKWSQALNDNYGGPAPAHDATPPAAVYEMDVATGKTNDPPLYPFSYDDGRFYDKPGAVCLHNQTVFFHAVCLISTADYVNRKLTTYRGFEYGWDYTCTHQAVPEPSAMAALGIGGLGLLRARRARKQGTKTS